jgi:TPR repeat protein
MYDKGQGVPKDDAEAVKWFRKSAEQGNATGQYSLGDKYANVLGGTTDYIEAHKWLNLAAAQGDEDAKKERDHLAQLMTLEEIAKAQRLAREWSRAHVSADSAEAKRYRSSADEGDAVAQYNLGDMYEKGDGVVQDYTEAHKWLNLAAAHGNKDAEKGRDRIATSMTQNQIAEAQLLAREWKPKTSR